MKYYLKILDVDRNNLPDYVRDICKEYANEVLVEIEHKAMKKDGKVDTEFWDLTYYNRNMESFTFIRVAFQPWNKSYPIHRDYVIVSMDKLKEYIRTVEE